MNESLASKLTKIAIWVGLCFIPVVGQTLSSLWFVLNVVLAIRGDE